jgi:hypothetical protein
VSEILLAIFALLIAAGGIIAAIAAVSAKGAEERRKSQQECDERVQEMERRFHRERERSSWDR